MTAFAPAVLAIAVLQVGPPARAEVEPAAFELSVDASRQLDVRVFDEGGNPLVDLPVRWLSVSPAVLSVDVDGRVTALRPGEARVAAVVGGAVVGFATVTVAQLPAAELSIGLPGGVGEGVMVGTSAPLMVHAVTRLGDVIEPSNLRFDSSDPDVASVDRGGRVYGMAAGSARIRAAAGDVVSDVQVTVVDNPGVTFALTPAPSEVRTGDVIRFQVAAGGAQVWPEWGVSGSGAEITAEDGAGVFVAEEPGRYRVTALIGLSDVRSAVVEVGPRRADAELVQVGRGPIADHHSGDVWVFEGVNGRDYAYIGTFMHDWMKAWDVTDPANPVLTDSIQLDARRINDVKIHPNSRVGIVTREGASDRRNGMVLLDLSDPAHPTVLSEYKETVTGGVHNVWIEGETNLVYACHNGTSDLHIIDIADPANPKEIGRWGLEKQGKTLHDVIVQDGYAYLSYWDDGVIMLDVGAGSHGGTPAEPAFVSQFKYPIGNTHVAWRHGRYLFVGDEIFPDQWNADRPIEARGYIHVIDYEDPENPREVAKYEVPEAGAHNVWVDDDKLYVGYYQAGLRVVDISGELRGDLYRQGREIAVLQTTDSETTVPNWPMAWGAQIHKGNIFSSDLNSGLWITKLQVRPVVMF